jgi:quercetin dioxygenase-like cupin family protein
MSSSRRLWILSAASVAMFWPGSVLAQGAAGQGTVVNIAEMKFVAFPGLPTCATGAVQSGDPAKGPAIIVSKTAAGCAIPWHWHTPTEHLMMVSGVAHLEMKDAKPAILRAGGFAMMPSHHVHQFRCTEACSFYVYSDAPFDIHYVDGQGKDLSPDEALRAVKETAAKEMK